MGFWKEVAKLFRPDKGPKREIPTAVVPNPLAPYVPPVVRQALPPVVRPYPDGWGTENAGTLEAEILPERRQVWWYDTWRDVWVPDRELEPGDEDRYRKSPG